MNPDSNGPTKMETILGGKQITVTWLNRQESETAVICQLPIEKMPELLKAIDSEPAAVELYCGKPKGWSLNMAPAVFEEIITEGERLNVDFFSRWVKRQMARQERLIPGIGKMVEKRTESILGIGLPNSPSSPA